jgi:hypothetical protein
MGMTNSKNLRKQFGVGERSGGGDPAPRTLPWQPRPCMCPRPVESGKERLGRWWQRHYGLCEEELVPEHHVVHPEAGVGAVVRNYWLVRGRWVVAPLIFDTQYTGSSFSG